MSLDIDELKRKISYRSNYRGTKEMDILLSSFVKGIIDQLNKEELENLLNFLNIDDENLNKYKQELKTEVKISENKITRLFKDFIYQK
jgi:antitoxin CptB